MSFGLHAHIIIEGKDEQNYKWLCSMVLLIELGCKDFDSTFTHFKDPNSTFTHFKGASSTFIGFKRCNAFNLEVPKGGR